MDKVNKMFQNIFLFNYLRKVFVVCITKEVLKVLSHLSVIFNTIYELIPPKSCNTTPIQFLCLDIYEKT